MSQSLLVPHKSRAREDTGHSTGPRMTGTTATLARQEAPSAAQAPAQSDYTRKVSAVRRAGAPREGRELQRQFRDPGLERRGDSCDDAQIDARMSGACAAYEHERPAWSHTVRNVVGHAERKQKPLVDRPEDSFEVHLG